MGLQSPILCYRSGKMNPDWNEIFRGHWHSFERPHRVPIATSLYQLEREQIDHAAADNHYVIESRDANIIVFKSRITNIIDL